MEKSPGRKIIKAAHSTIMIINSEFFKSCGRMKIDETGEEYDLSDHELMTAHFVVEWNKGEKCKGEQY